VSEVFAFLLSGITVGFIYTLVGLGFTVIYNSSGIINFSQGEFVMAGGMSSVFLIYAGLPLGVSFILAIMITSMIGIVLYKLIHISKDSSQISLIILTLGFAIWTLYPMYISYFKWSQSQKQDLLKVCQKEDNATLCRCIDESLFKEYGFDELQLLDKKELQEVKKDAKEDCLDDGWF